MSIFDDDVEAEMNANPAEQEEQNMERVEAEVEDPRKEKEPEQPKSIVSTALAKQVEELLSGARIEKIASDEELTNSVNLLSKLKKTRKDLETEKEKNVSPLYEKYLEAHKAYKTKIDALLSLEDNIGNKGAEWQKSERIRIEKEAEAQRQKIAAEKKRLSDIEDAKILEEEKLRMAAEEKLNSVDLIDAQIASNRSILQSLGSALAATENQDEKITFLKRTQSINKSIAKLVEKRNALVKESNVATEQANVVVEQAADIEKQIQALADAPVPAEKQKVATPLGFKGKTVYSAIVTDHWSALKALVAADQRGYLDCAGLRKAIESAANEMAKNMETKFSLAGCTLDSKEVGGKSMRR